MTLFTSILKRRRISGMTMAEVMISAAVASILAAGLVTGAIILQKNFLASLRYSRSQAQQVRLLDYISLDLRRATTASVAGGILTITIPAYYDSAGDPRNPTLSMGRVYYDGPTAAVTIRYYLQNGQVMRQEGTTTTVIADQVQDFQLNFRNEGQVVETSVTFLPTFQQNSDGSNVRDGTAKVTRTLLRNKLQS